MLRYIFMLSFLFSSIFSWSGDFWAEEPLLSPYSGLPILEVDQIKRPVMATVENSAPARPQAGLEEAEIVYEFLVEGGITRFLALYFNHFPEKVGPIRSARSYLLETALEFNPIYLHIGGSPESYALLGELSLTHLDEMGAGRTYFWRSSNRSAPFNLYTDLLHISRSFSAEPFLPPEPYFTFQNLRSPLEGLRSQEITVPYWGGYTVVYRFQEEAGNYGRYIGGAPHLMENGVQLTAHNVLILFTSTRVVDSAGRLQMDLQDGGPLLLFRDGMVFEGEWVKKDGLTHYLDREGEELFFKPGQTWINVVPMRTTINY